MIDPHFPLYQGDPLNLTCEITGGHPLGNISWICPHDSGLSVTPGGDTNKRWSTLSGTLQGSLNNKVCTCSAHHFAWDLNTKNKTLGPFVIFCKYNLKYIIFFFIYIEYAKSIFALKSKMMSIIHIYILYCLSHSYQSKKCLVTVN